MAHEEARGLIVFKLKLDLRHVHLVDRHTKNANREM
jgi:hypothetical protein